MISASENSTIDVDSCKDIEILMRAKEVCEIFDDELLLSDLYGSICLNENEKDNDADDEYETDSNISRSDSSLSNYDGEDSVFYESGNEEQDASSDLEYLKM